MKKIFVFFSMTILFISSIYAETPVEMLQKIGFDVAGKYKCIAENRCQIKEVLFPNWEKPGTYLIVNTRHKYENSKSFYNGESEISVYKNENGVWKYFKGYGGNNFSVSLEQFTGKNADDLVIDDRGGMAWLGELYIRKFEKDDIKLIFSTSSTCGVNIKENIIIDCFPGMINFTDRGKCFMYLPRVCEWNGEKVIIKDDDLNEFRKKADRTIDTKQPEQAKNLMFEYQKKAKEDIMGFLIIYNCAYISYHYIKDKDLGEMYYKWLKSLALKYDWRTGKFDKPENRDASERFYIDEEKIKAEETELTKILENKPESSTDDFYYCSCARSMKKLTTEILSGNPWDNKY